MELLFGALLVILGSAGAYTPKQQLDINNANLAQIESLPIPTSVARDIYLHLKTYGPLKSIYDLRKVRSLSAEDFERIKLLIRITVPPVRREGTRYVHRIQRELTDEESPTEAAIEEWQDLVLSPMNINRATVDDLLLLNNVSIIDAMAVVRHTQAGREIKNAYELRTMVQGLSDYGYRNMRSFVTFKEPVEAGFDGNWRLNYDYSEDFPVQDKLAYLAQNLRVLSDRVRFRDAGFTDRDIDYYEQRLTSQREYLARYQTANSLRNRFRCRIGDNLRLGFWANKDFQRTGAVNDFKGFAALYDLPVLKKVFIGNYRVTVGQGLMIDNSQELRSRMHERTVGLFNDLTPDDFMTFRGAAVEARVPWTNLLLFYSRNARDGILNPDGTINYYAYTWPVLPANRHNFTELNWGGSVRANLGRIPILPVGSYIGFNGLVCSYDREFVPDARWLDLPGDAVLLRDANYTQLTHGGQRQFYGFDFRTAVSNLSLEGEFARQHQRGMAYLIKGRTQYNYLYLTALYRHYDADYDNPYNRGFAEQRRFEDTPIEKPYRLIDPTLSDMMDFPLPKAEEGIYAEMRYQVSRQITFTRVYMDIWQNLATGLNNYRFQGEVEWRPVFPLRLRLKQKVQEKNLAKDVLPTRSRTWETSLRSLVSLSNYDFLITELRAGNVRLTPSLRYGSNTTIWGGFLSSQWEHNFSDDFSTELGIAVWQTDGMSQWIFDDVGIDFLDGRGMKYYITASDRISDILLLKLKFRQKLSEYAHTGLAGDGSGLHFAEPGTGVVRDFTALRNNFYVGLQLDFLW